MNFDNSWSNQTQNPKGIAVLELTEGVYDLNIWMREDGTMIREIRLTIASEYKP